MEKFQEILTEAAQLKQQQLKNERKNYQSQPEYIKSGLNYHKKYAQLRKQHFLVQIHMSQKLKKQGNQKFKSQNYAEALTKYEEALGIFRYISAKTYDNMKDDDMSYHLYELSIELKHFQQDYRNQMAALYMNICSCLTKLNKKQDALHSIDEALKISENAKAYYKKAQVYLQYINKETADVKLGFLYLNKCYELSKDPSIIQQMYKIKKQIDEERNKEKKMFKFMFDKSKNNNNQKDEQPQKKNNQKQKVRQEMAIKNQNLGIKQKQNLDKNQLTRKKQLDDYLSQIKQMTSFKQKIDLNKQSESLLKTKQKLLKYADMKMSQQQWKLKYEQDFITKQGSKIYSIIQLFGYKQYLGEYKCLLAQCLDTKNIERQKKKQNFDKYFAWLRLHPIDKIQKYVEKYDVQTKWIEDQRSQKTRISVKQDYKIQEQIRQATEQQKQQNHNRQQILNQQKQLNIQQKKQLKTEQEKKQDEKSEEIQKQAQNLINERSQFKFSFYQIFIALIAIVLLTKLII